MQSEDDRSLTSRPRPARRTVGRTAAALFLLASALSTPASASAPAEPGAAPEAAFDYLYIEANEGGSSGGHAGIRSGRNVYHFQNKDGLLVLHREPSNEFLYTYALLSNRTIEVSRVGVSAQDADRIDSQLARRHRAQQAQFDVLASLGSDLALLEAMLEARVGDTHGRAASLVSISVPGLGYFRTPGRYRAPGGGCERTRASTLVGLRDEITVAHGATFLETRANETRRALEEAVGRDPAAWSAPPPASAYQHPPFSEPWSTRVAALVSGLAALDILSCAAALDPSAILSPDGPDFALTPDERSAMRRHRDELASQLMRVVRSNREDWGYVALIGMARLAALDESLHSNRVVVLDTLPTDADRIDRRSVRRRRAIMREILAETRREVGVARRFLTRAEEPGEIVWERYEERVNRHLELRRAIRDGADLRVSSGHLIPERPAPFAVDRLPSPSRASLEASLERVRERHSRHGQRLDALYAYELITRNCVSALFETLNDGFGDSPLVSAEALGGWVDGRSGLGFIPFVSAAQVDERFRVVAREVIPSYRRMRLAEMEREDAGLLTALRESNTLTSTTYRRAERDSFFVFFTDDATLLRPLFGAVNLVGALGEITWGALKLPFDRGRSFVSGLKGAFMSLPELAFFNIRKGSNDWIAPERRTWRPEPRR